MSHGSLTPQIPMTRLTAAERDWIRRQGMTARAWQRSGDWSASASRQPTTSSHACTSSSVARLAASHADKALGCAQGTDQLPIDSGRLARPRFASRARRTAIR
jgi:hypothetical protein